MPLPFFGRRAKSRRSILALDDLVQPRRFDNEAMIRAMCMNAYLGAETSLCRVLGRYKLFVDTADVGHSSHLLLDGFWEMWVTEVLAQLVKPGMVVADVGANLGYFTVLMADLVGEHGHVHAFEPNPPIADRLRRSCVVNGFHATATVHPEPLGDEDGMAVALSVPFGEPKNAHVVPAALSPDPHALPLTTRRMDSFPELADVDVVKIDAEGFEEAIWHGMAGIFARGRPCTVVLEFAAARYADPGAFLDEIAGLGFRVELIAFDGGIVPRSRAELLAAPAAEDQMLVLRR